MTDPPPFDPVSTARSVLRIAATGALATLAPDGAPFATLVTVATSPEGEPVLLLSDLAEHTKNVRRDARVSLLLVSPGGESGDPLAGARLTLNGTIAADSDATSRRRFLARHPEARGYSEFRDFHFYRMAIIGAHLVAGFGRIVDLMREELLLDCSDAADLLAAEESAIAHMNEDHADALALYATRLLGMADGDWRVTGADPEGIDLSAGALRARLAFTEKVRTASELRAMLVRLAKAARARPPIPV
jgi:putative heme iron utilization protein